VHDAENAEVLSREIVEDEWGVLAAEIIGGIFWVIVILISWATGAWERLTVNNPGLPEITSDIGLYLNSQSSGSWIIKGTSSIRAPALGISINLRVLPSDAPEMVADSVQLQFPWVRLMSPVSGGVMYMSICPITSIGL
jgi:hypothetical protein